MGRERLSMRQTKEILRQKLLLHRSHREVAQSLRVGIGTITSTLARGSKSGCIRQRGERSGSAGLPTGPTSTRNANAPG
jgi:transposase